MGKTFEEIVKNKREKDKAYIDALKDIYETADTRVNAGGNTFSELQEKLSFGSQLRADRDRLFKENIVNFYDNFFDKNGNFRRLLMQEAAKYQSHAAPQEPKANNVFASMYLMLDKYENDIKDQRNAQNPGIARLGKLTDQMIDELNACMLYKASENNELFSMLYQAVLNINCEAKDITEGRLFVPEKGSVLNGKKVHHVSNVVEIDPVGGKKQMQGKYQPDVPKECLDPDYQCSQKQIRGPLFTHDPVPEDIVQGNLGDCYFLAALQGIAAQDPERIRDMIRDNNDGSCTVRFFNYDQEPVYVTVDKSYPVYNNIKNGNDISMSGGEPWVTMMEKAYALSGLNRTFMGLGLDNGRLADAESGKYHGSYADIEGGQPEMVVSLLLGTDAKLYYGSAETVPTPSMEKSGPYNQEEKDFFDKITNAIHDKKIVTTSVCHIMAEYFKSQEKKLADMGITNMHAYTVTGTEIDPNTQKMYIRVRNPHAGVTLGYATGEAKAVDEFQSVHKGESLVEIRDFCKLFNYTDINGYDFSAAKRYDLADADIVRANYGQAVSSFAQAIAGQDSWLLRKTHRNSPEYTQLRLSALKVQAAFADKASDSLTMCNAMKDFFNKSTAYKAYCQHNPEKQAEMNERASMRYLINNSIQELKKAFEKNNEKDICLQEKADYKQILKDSLTVEVASKEIGGLNMRDQVKDPMLKKALETLAESEALKEMESKVHEIAKSNEVKQVPKNGMLIM